MKTITRDETEHGVKYYLASEVDLLLAQPAQEPVGTLNISRYKGHLVNHDFDYFGELPDGTYSVYTTPPQPAQEPYDQTALELCGVCGWKTLIPDDGCLNCERAQPAQEPVAHILQFIKELRPAIGPMAVMGKSKTTQEWFDIVINEIERLQTAKEKNNG